MTTGGGALRARDLGDSLQEVAEEFGRVVRMDDIRGAAAKVEGVQ